MNEVDFFTPPFQGYHFSNKEEKEKYISECVTFIRDNNISYPIPKISEQEARNSYNDLKKLSSSSLLKFGKWKGRKNYKYEFLDMYINNSKIGNNASNCFHIQDRYSVGSISHSRYLEESVLEKWRIDRYLKYAIRALIRFNNEFTLENLNVAFALQFYIASQFRPSTAKCIYDLFESKYVLDFSSGWGID